MAQGTGRSAGPGQSIAAPRFTSQWSGRHAYGNCETVWRPRNILVLHGLSVRGAVTKSINCTRACTPIWQAPGRVARDPAQAECDGSNGRCCPPGWPERDDSGMAARGENRGQEDGMGARATRPHHIRPAMGGARAPSRAGLGQPGPAAIPQVHACPQPCGQPCVASDRQRDMLCSAGLRHRPAQHRPARHAVIPEHHTAKPGREPFDNPAGVRHAGGVREEPEHRHVRQPAPGPPRLDHARPRDEPMVHDPS